MNKKEKNRRINIFLLAVYLGVFGTGLIMFLKFHVGDGSIRETFIGVQKSVWLNTHRVMAIAFLTGCIIHKRRYWKLLTRHRLLFIESILVMGTGFYAWIALSQAGSIFQESIQHHHLIDSHNIIGLFLLFSLTVHIKRRWHRFFHMQKKI
ncbi:DUF4405 domain-containing protein [Desulfitobacterium sp. PCE1]|uniref:DUF4405 domain-containing protein n=1 Tax=Desulfitobacterium sp. PCE1 TaxID=146907 RepID=UPI000366902A|nr:DUF4405 domain-containing protein [Desulfitobacterium sp. PCE1]